MLPQRFCLFINHWIERAPLAPEVDDASDTPRNSSSAPLSQPSSVSSSAVPPSPSLLAIPPLAGGASFSLPIGASHQEYLQVRLAVLCSSPSACLCYSSDPHSNAIYLSVAVLIREALAPLLARRGSRARYQRSVVCLQLRTVVSHNLLLQ